MHDTVYTYLAQSIIPGTVYTYITQPPHILDTVTSYIVQSKLAYVHLNQRTFLTELDEKVAINLDPDH